MTHELMKNRFFFGIQLQNDRRSLGRATQGDIPWDRVIANCSYWGSLYMTNRGGLVRF